MAGTKPAPRGAAAAKRIDALIDRTDDWRGQRLAEVRSLILGAVDGVEQTWKWMGSPVWEKDGILLVGNAHQDKVKLTFPHGADLAARTGCSPTASAADPGAPSTCTRTRRWTPPRSAVSSAPRPTTTPGAASRPLPLLTRCGRYPDPDIDHTG